MESTDSRTALDETSSHASLDIPRSDLLSRPSGPSGRVLGAVTLLLFLIWSNTFIAIGYLLGAESRSARFDWVSLTIARFIPVLPICLVYCLLPRRWPVTVQVVRRHWRRLIAAGLMAVPFYNCALYFGQQHGVPAPVASLTTTLAPIFILVFSILFLGEKLTIRRALGFGLCIVGMGVISFARRGSEAAAYPLVIAVTALAPLSWSCFSVLTKPMTRTVDPVHWTFLALVFGSLPGLFLLPWSGGPEMWALDGFGWGALLYLSLLATVVGFAIWTWLLRHLPASTVGLTVFLNPPLTTISKAVLAVAIPSVFTFGATPMEGVGGAIVLAGLAVGILR
jgi:drug/metabolite transporter (DMT)-like permease